MIPIWKDYDFLLSSSAPSTGILYRVEYEGDVIYTGRAYPRPYATTTTIRVNDIVAPLLVRGFAPAGETDTPYAEVTIKSYESGSWATVGVLTFYADWSYDVDFDAKTDSLSAPIGDILLPGQLLPFTPNTEDETVSTIVTFLVYAYDGVADFNPDFNEDFLIYGDETPTPVYVEVDAAGTAWLDLMDYPGATKVAVGGKTWRVGGGSCNKHAFYYVNAYGGWDTLVVQGKTAESDALTRYTTDKVYDNAQTYARGRVNYVNELAHRYTFNTQPLADAESLKMHHLLNSPHVYVHNTVTGHIRPLVLTGTATEYKHGGKLYQYAIEAQLAQERLRR